MRIMARLVTVVVVFVVVGVSVAIGNAVGMPVGQSAPLGLLLAGVTALAVNWVLGDGEIDRLVAVVSFVMLLFAALGALVTGKEMWPRANALLLFAGAIAVEVAAFLLLSGLLTAVIQGVARSRQTRQRRHLADSRGWRIQDSDAALPSALGGTDHFVAHIPGRLLVVGPRPVPEQARAYDVISGDVGGVEFAAFDFFVPRRLRPPEVTTAWLVRLPHALPLFTSAEMFRDAPDGRGGTLGAAAFGFAERDNSVTVTNPDYARAVMTDDVVAFTRQRLKSWWVDGDILASTARVRHGAPPDLLASNVEAITQLAIVLSSPRLADHAVGAAGSREPHPT